ncbi:CocE/NonD family hydrolase [Pseudonocardia kujensis]|uniref:CocE/NonD family hydrolase n=1 Tax=Pseudonocardia kujensis TaxID=1128675 RepID=UPI001E38D8AD|nr:CocE/NonD family hydrolase [Pseudonocardia kujensis]MCE0768597.1 CocE/NonD family hydrolase [Pseudonocardia kujensis]
MRDGVRLATDVYLPDTDGPVPVVLTRLPYDKNGQIIRVDVFAEALLERGYALVAQDCRGKFRSEGETVPWVNEALDGYDTIEWIVNQSWSNGRVGMTGLSYVGYTQWAALSTNHPALRAIAPRATNTNLGAAQLTPGEPEWTFYFQYVMDFYAVNDLLDHEQGYDWSHRPLIKAFEEAAEQMGVKPPAMDMHLSPQPPLRRYPEGHPLDAKPVPVLLSLGWFDPYCRAEAMQDYRAMVGNPAWKPIVHLRLGPHDHDDTRLDDRPANLSHGGSIDVPQLTPEQIRTWFEGELQFFDRYLKGNDDVEPLPAVEYQLAHSSEVRQTSSWPPPEATRRVLHLAGGQDATTGRLLPQQVGDVSPVSWTHDPDKLVPTATQFWSLLVAEWPDFRETVDREDVLTFRCDPLIEPLELAGPVTFHGRVTTTGPAMDLFAYLLDLEPDGSVRFICRGQQRLTASEPTDLTMSVGEAGYVLQPDHSLLLMLASSDYPDFIPLTGTQERWWFATSMRATNQTLEIGGPAGARLEITTL